MNDLQKNKNKEEDLNPS